MKRKDFLRKMRDRRRGGGFEERQPEKRRKVDWRTVRVDLPVDEEPATAPETTPVGTLIRRSSGVRLEVASACWVRGYRSYEADGTRRAEFQYRPAEPDAEAPPGAQALSAGDIWEPRD